jgi:integrase
VEELSGKRVGPPTSRFRLEKEVASAWLASLALRPKTLGNYTEFSARWIRRVRAWDPPGLASYIRERLRESLAKTVKSEVSGLRGLLKWLFELNYLDEFPLPRVPKGALGAQASRRTRVAAPELERSETGAILRHLADKADTGWWVRPRCEFLYLSSLRPSTVDALSVPEHWEPGSKTLRISSDIDKEGFARELPLPAKALAILERCAPESGVIFGAHKYYRYIRKAVAEAVKKRLLSPGKAAIFTGQHLRSARATHLLDGGASLTGAQYLLGHTRASTTARYARPSMKQAIAALKKVPG